MISLDMPQVDRLRRIMMTSDTFSIATIHIHGLDEMDKGFEEEELQLHGAVVRFAELAIGAAVGINGLSLKVGHESFLVVFDGKDTDVAITSMNTASSSFEHRPFGWCSSDPSLPRMTSGVYRLSNDQRIAALASPGYKFLNAGDVDSFFSEGSGERISQS